MGAADEEEEEEEWEDCKWISYPLFPETRALPSRISHSLTQFGTDHSSITIH